jgi:hypothetical protein
MDEQTVDLRSIQLKRAFERGDHGMNPCHRQIVG